jgi:hypothetical protein
VQAYWHGVGGAYVTSKTKAKSLWCDLYLVNELEIDCTVIDIGSNDLCLKSHPSELNLERGKRKKTATSWHNSLPVPSARMKK